MPKFVFEVTVEAPEHTPEAEKKATGKDFFNPDFPRETYARELLGEAFRRAVLDCLNSKLANLEVKGRTPEDDKRLAKHLDAQIELYETMNRTVKLVRILPEKEVHDD